MIGVLITPTQDGAKEAGNGTTETVTEVVSTNNTVVSEKDGANSADQKVTEQDTIVKESTEEQTTEQSASEQKSENQDVTEQVTSEVTEGQTTEVQTTEAQTTEMQATETQVTKEQTTEEYTTAEQTPVTSTYVLNTSKMKFHKPNCSSVKQMKDSNRSEYNGTRDEVIAMGYSPCGRCKP